MISALTDTPLEIPAALEAFHDASPELVDARRLEQRIDRKYLLPKRQLESLLARLCPYFLVVRAEGRLAATYDSRYFDTPDRQMYEDHRRGRGRRHKVRIRHHLERQLSFLEVKGKTANNHTTKARLSRRFSDSALDEEGFAFIEAHCPFRAALLTPRLSTAFRRVTLVGQQVNERITIDWDFEVRDDHRREMWPHVAIAEIKQPRYSNSTDAVRAFRSLPIREMAVSKYCVATAMLASVRRNTFRPVLRAMEQLSA